MKVKGYILCMCLALTAVAGYGQKTDRDYLRSGNKLYKDSLFVKAEVDYRKALELNPKSADAMYNLGNALMMQERPKRLWSSLMQRLVWKGQEEAGTDLPQYGSHFAVVQTVAAVY